MSVHVHAKDGVYIIIFKPKKGCFCCQSVRSTQGKSKAVRSTQALNEIVRSTRGEGVSPLARRPLKDVSHLCSVSVMISV